MGAFRRALVRSRKNFPAIAGILGSPTFAYSCWQSTYDRVMATTIIAALALAVSLAVFVRGEVRDRQVETPQLGTLVHPIEGPADLHGHHRPIPEGVARGH